MKSALLQRLLKARAEKRPVVLVTDMISGTQSLIIDGVPTRIPGTDSGGDSNTDADSSPAGNPDTAMLEAAAEVLLRDKGEIREFQGQSCFLQPFAPPRRMIVVGAVHIAQSLVPMAQIAGYEVIIVDPRGAFATSERFPDTTLRESWPDEALEALAPDRGTAVVTLTHDPKLDDPALTAALTSEAFYIGALGSKRTHARRLERLRENGLGDDAFARIHAPVGLDIGAISPAEIAIAIMAEVTHALHARQQSNSQ